MNQTTRRNLIRRAIQVFPVLNLAWSQPMQDQWWQWFEMLYRERKELNL